VFFSGLTNGLGFEFNNGNATILKIWRGEFYIYCSSIILEELTSAIARGRYLYHKRTLMSYYIILNVTR